LTPKSLNWALIRHWGADPHTSTHGGDLDSTGWVNLANANSIKRFERIKVATAA
jgi:hypothetical protein